MLRVEPFRRGKTGSKTHDNLWLPGCLMVWWPKVTQGRTKPDLSRIQRLARLCVTGASTSTPTAMEIMLNIPPLDISTRHIKPNL